MHSDLCVSAASQVDTLLCMDVPDLDHGSHVPLYIQGADWITAQVSAGKLVPGTRLPAERDLAEQWGVAYMTVRRMMAELRERNVIVSQPGKGTYVL
jgi:GntR family transcriptional regulator